MKHTIKELDRGQLDLMWNFLRFDCGQKSDIPTLKEHLDMLRQAMIQHLMNSGQMNQSQYNQLKQIAGQIQNNPQFQQSMQQFYEEQK